MSNRFRLAALVLASLTLPAAAQTVFAQPAQKAPAAKAAPAASNSPVVARVNGQPITRADVEAVYATLPPQMQQMPLDAIFPALVNEMISRKLIGEAAEKAKLGDDPKVQAQLRMAREQVLQQAFLEQTLDKQITEARIKARYEELLKSQPPRDEVHARHILTATEADAQAALEEVRKGADFAEVSKKRSTGPTAATGGDLGFFTKEQMVPEFAEAAFALQAGQVSPKPVKSQFGWHVIKVEARRVAPPPALAEVIDDIRELLTREIVETTLADLRKTAKIEQIEQPKPAGQLPTIAPKK
ncbi:peptidylprolyl isomerase [Ferrovibrio sp.]|uniref:peptidylprolyl isomerase n=1 Tax=Ferrovibrio sp. TaxID=1917215 RepID=UPI0025BBEE4D|nr:peptidylprolyl isomerase [Ferrovibrio sp.]MBX3455758.1 peptidylprolyl isomerase [Ferrovibrio sp.]